jgi:hypothetical protein
VKNDTKLEGETARGIDKIGSKKLFFVAHPTFHISGNFLSQQAGLPSSLVSFFTFYNFR